MTTPLRLTIKLIKEICRNRC